MKVPTEKDIESLEQRLSEMRAAREAAKKDVLEAMRSNAIFDLMDKDELASVFRRMQNYIKGNHKRNRGSPVPENLKAALIETIKQGDKAPSLSGMADMFNLSVSYISKIKRELKEAGEIEQPVLNAYDSPEFKLHAHN